MAVGQHLTRRRVIREADLLLVRQLIEEEEARGLIQL